MKRPGIGIALFIILMLTAALLGVSYLAAQWLGTPFVPVDLSAWLAQSGLESWPALVESVNNILTNLGIGLLTSTTTAEAFLAILLFFGYGIVIGLGFYAITGRRGNQPDLIDGLVAGAFFGAPMVFISLAVGTSTLPPLLNITWLALLFLAWGGALGDSMARAMVPIPPQPPDDIEAVTVDEEPIVEVIDTIDTEEAVEDLTDTDLVEEYVAVKEEPQSIMGRRQFLLRFGASTAAIAAGSAVAGRAFAYQPPDVDEPRVPLPLAEPGFLEAQQELFGNFRRFAIVRDSALSPGESNVLALGAEYPDRNYISIWIGDGSPIIIYENLETAAEAFSSDGQPAAIYWLDN
jgi:hypothetical protein